MNASLDRAARRNPRLWITSALALTVVGCQAPGDEAAADRVSSESVRTADAAQESPARTGQSLRVGEIVSVTATVTGARDTTYEGSTEARNVQPSGGCRDGVLAMGFTFASPDGSSESWFRWEVANPMEPGATGTFPVSVSYWYPRLGLPSQNSYQGEGSLEITRHDARRGAARMSGRLVGQGLVERRGGAVDVEVTFDMGGSCGTLD